MSVYFISDLHLSEQTPNINQALLTFLNQLPRQTQALYILGDFLEYWIGDDHPSEWFKPIELALKDLSENTCPIYFIHGNRDFLVGKKFAKRCGMQLLPEPSVVELYGQKVLIMHGDSLCTQDESYQSYRKWVRKPWLQFLFSLLPKATREKIFGAGRAKSKQKQQNIQNMSILDVSQQAVADEMQAYQVNILIHGHTHRPAIHQNAIAQNTGIRIVLGDWYDQGSVLEVNQDGYLLYSLQF
ncbi:UDP-2,3-diacylglucosamine diphosphatase [Catenovulum sp. 2E275]|uniref:UDP-2,3-diacylglucosamine diphosphatase n=1 Tax=Catenovulum sp. 2E275 TaxID=2980497 RepID=UPI0021CE0644|nr:UDP-2,3-diacylglucosamine diphosphatase [Catenovulum sp. 2E275]MCU4675651.1 UDP-2,3-diacylglucosamine diphosphatase [Catenovulum sp. 2E275]